MTLDASEKRKAFLCVLLIVLTYALYLLLVISCWDVWILIWQGGMLPLHAYFFVIEMGLMLWLLSVLKIENRGLGLALTHAVFISALAMNAYLVGVDELWLLVLLVDFPASLVLPCVSLIYRAFFWDASLPVDLIDKTVIDAYRLNQTLLFWLSSTVFGSAQYYMIGWAIGRFWKGKKSPDSAEHPELARRMKQLALGLACVIMMAVVIFLVANELTGVNGLIRASQDEDEFVRASAIDGLIGALAAENFLVRHRVAWALGEIGPAAVPALVGALEDENANVRMGAAEVLGKTGPVTDDVIPALITALGDDNRYVRRRATWALGYIGPAAKDTVPALITALGNENRRDREKAAAALGNMGPAAKDAVPALKKLLEDEDEYVFVCISVACALGRIDSAAKDAISFLITALGDEDESVRMGAAAALGDIGPVTDDVIPALITALGDEDWGVRYFAAAALGKIGPAAEDAIPALQGLSEESDPVRQAAKDAIAEIHEAQNRNDK